MPSLPETSRTLYLSLWVKIKTPLDSKLIKLSNGVFYYRIIVENALD